VGGSAFLIPNSEFRIPSSLPHQTSVGRSSRAYNRFVPFRSRRIPHDLGPNRLAAARSEIGRIEFDLTKSNPTACGFPVSQDLLRELGNPQCLRYTPDPRGPLATRRAIGAEYRRWGLEVDPERLVLTASTSEAYSFLFRLLCDPGEAVLVPTPSYPLFEHLTRIDGIGCETYPLEADACWRLDMAAVGRATERVRAVIVVHPNNPTGSFIHPDDRAALVTICRDRRWALIADEVFLDYPLDGGPGADTSFADVGDCLCLTLGGLSKSLGLPQLKVAWIAASGPEAQVGSVLEGLEYVADAYLSVSTPAALATPRLLSDSAPLRNAIADRCRSNLAILRTLVSEHPEVTVSTVGGGWSAVLRVPAVMDEEALSLRLLEDHSVAVHHGGLFGFPSRGWLVISLLPPTELFAEGVRLMLRSIAGTLGHS
jgi:aspartate/methionine/tyrosine aminotransferase